MEKEKKNEIKSLFYFVIGILIAVNIYLSFTIIPGGERGVVFSKTTGVQGYVFDEGFHFKKPIIDEVIKFEVRTTKTEMTTASTSQDQQIVTAVVALNYHLNPETVNKLYQEVGTDYIQRIINPALEGSIKTGMAQFKAEELIRQRELVVFKITEILKQKLEDKHIIVDNVNLINVDFSEKYDAAIESKVEAEQQAKKAENDLQRIKIEKEQIIVRAEAEKQKSILNAQAQAESILIQAQAEAEAIKVKQEALKQSREVLDYKWIETWDGKLPHYYGGNANLLLSMNKSN